MFDFPLRKLISASHQSNDFALPMNFIGWSFKRNKLGLMGLGDERELTDWAWLSLQGSFFGLSKDKLGAQTNLERNQPWLSGCWGLAACFKIASGSIHGQTMNVLSSLAPKVGEVLNQ